MDSWQAFMNDSDVKQRAITKACEEFIYNCVTEQESYLYKFGHRNNLLTDWTIACNCIGEDPLKNVSKWTPFGDADFVFDKVITINKYCKNNWNTFSDDEGNRELKMSKETGYLWPLYYKWREVFAKEKEGKNG